MEAASDFPVKVHSLLCRMLCSVLFFNSRETSPSFSIINSPHSLSLMDAMFGEFSPSMNEFNYNHRSSVSGCSNQSLAVNGFSKLNQFLFDDLEEPILIQTNPEPPIPLSSTETVPASSMGARLEESDHSNAVLKYISEMLMEEDLGKKNCMLQDCMALQAAEKSFYDVLSHNHPPSIHNPDENFTSQSNWVGGVSEFQGYSQPLLSDFQAYQQPLLSDSSSSSDIVDGLVDSPVSTLFVPNKPSWQFLAHSYTLDSGKKKTEEENSFRGRKNHHRHGEDGDLEESGRISKQSAVYTHDASEQLEMFDKVLLLCDAKICNESRISTEGENNQQVSTNRVNKNSSKGKKRGGGAAKKTEMVDLRGLLTQCAQAVATSDQRNTSELLKQIRQHSSIVGDGTQRMAHYFANGLEARLAGTSQTQLHTTTFATGKTSAAVILKAYKIYITACPFRKMSDFFANKTILKLTERATRIHIIDFGILYGFQWPCLIQHLSERPGGPPNLRITGIELPQPGFRPAERVEETGRRLTKYCERFNVPFVYNAIAQKWETIQLEDLKIEKGEIVIVNCMYRLKNLPDDAIVPSSPRNKVLNLIKRINPDMFIHGVVNGTYNAPFFLTRFRETMFHFSAMFDMFDATISNKNDEDRILFEEEVFGRDAINIIACEGLDRVDRPETYKQWQVRNVRAGFKQLPLDKDIFMSVRSKVKMGYHKDFVVDENGGWMWQGWKGRIIYGLSCWKPSN